ncbi:hypothetical protein [Thalassomonas sp. RHCl1]|uniref:hypothetical protein n=1 Tax=Thalassomonas sp. RHCl1 TaxID=2995320 RepID=UPI00248C42C7|nr:hypothetical protein [Thalassomonas sp. RHCl1]
METVELEAIIKVGLHKECMKDRKGYGTGIRPNHWIPGREYTFMGQIDFEDRDWLHPGETCKARFRFLIPAQDQSKFVTGFTWHICEVNQIMGYGTIISIINN